MERLQLRVGKRMRVLVDSVANGSAIARSEGDAPQIDGVVHIESAGKLKDGDQEVRSLQPTSTTSTRRRQRSP
jgi:hypothetical protein